ncbi:MAG: hypothetical protein HY726_05295 [Candidatus Rokubacteria bacterium]|nr:hypothetical protein [Candidatus Rokubacteria bacterium]
MDSPAWRLAQALATLKDQDGNILVEGFYDNVRPPDAEDRQLLEQLKATFDEEQARRELGIYKFKRGKPGTRSWRSSGSISIATEFPRLRSRFRAATTPPRPPFGPTSRRRQSGRRSSTG